MREQVVESSRRKAWTLHACFTIGHLAVTRIQISIEWFRLFINMKKTVLFLFMLLLSHIAQAQLVGFQGHVDEYDIQGRWVVSSFEGQLIQLCGEFEYISFSGNQSGRLYMKQGDDLFFLLWFYT